MWILMKTPILNIWLIIHGEFWTSLPHSLSHMSLMFHSFQQFLLFQMLILKTIPLFVLNLKYMLILMSIPLSLKVMKPPCRSIYTTFKVFMIIQFPKSLEMSLLEIALVVKYHQKFSFSWILCCWLNQRKLMMHWMMWIGLELCKICWMNLKGTMFGLGFLVLWIK